VKAIAFEAEWAPREGSCLSDVECATRVVKNGSQVFRNPTFSVVEIPVPEPGPDEVLIRVKACGFCGSDVHCYETDNEGYIIFPGDITSPIVLGHEFSGVIEQVGSAVRDFHVGDMVAVEEMLWCGECRACRAGLFNQCQRLEHLGYMQQGAMAEYIAVKAKYVWKIDGLTQAYQDDDKVFEAGAMVEPASVAYNAMFPEAGGFRPGAYVSVFGTGPIGLCAIALARAAGASKIVAFEVSKKRGDLARTFGVNAVYNPVELEAEGRSVAEVILEHTNGDGSDFMVEASGVPEILLPDCTRALAMDGKVVQIGRAPSPVPLNLEDFIVRGATLAAGIGHSGFGTFGNVIRLMASGRIDVTPAITGRYSLDDAVEGFSRLSKREDAKVMIRM